ncbi:MAG: hypothetical protein ACOCWJ_00425 [Verrucomicrobiota bacterium]
MTKTVMNDIFSAPARQGCLVAVFAATLAMTSGCASLRPPVPEQPEVGEASVLLELGAPDTSADVARPQSRPLQRYHRYWRRHRRQEIRAHHKEIMEAGNDDWGAGYRALLDELYSEENFREAAQILHDGLTRETSEDRESLESALGRHRIARLTYLTLVAEKRVDEDSSWRQTAEEARRRLRAVRDRKLPDVKKDAAPPTSD